MDTLDLLQTVLRLTLAAGTVLTPLYYEKYSLFARRARKAVDRLDKVENRDIVSDGVISIYSEDTGFRQLLSVLEENGSLVETYQSKEHGSVDITVNEIGQIWASRESLVEFFGWCPELFDDYEAIIYTSGEPKECFNNLDLTTSIVLRNSNFDIKPGFQATNEQMVENIMRKWISDTAQRRAHFLTAIIVVIWTTLLFMD